MHTHIYVDTYTNTNIYIFLEFCLEKMDLVQNHEHGNQIITMSPTAFKTFKK